MRFSGTRLSNRAEFVVDLSSKHEHLEYAGKCKMYPYRKCYVLHRFGSPVTTFEAGPAQEKKIKAGRGKITVTERMVWRASEGVR